MQFIKSAKLAGYEIILFFVWLENFELAKSRVASKVRKGGHNIPEEIIEGRYKKGINNLLKYTSEANDWYLYDNSGAEYVLIARSIERAEEIFNFEIFNKIIGK